MCQRHSCCAGVALSFMVVVVLLQCVAVVTPFWIYVFEGSYQCYFGLWQTCYEGTVEDQYICTDVFKDNRYSAIWYYLVQAFACSGLVTSLVTMAVAIQQQCSDRIDVCITVLLSVMSYITCAILITSLVFFIRNVNGIGTVTGQTMNYVPYMSASVYASGAAAIFSMLAGSVCVIVANNASKGSESDELKDSSQRQDNTEVQEVSEVQDKDGWISNRRFRSNKIFDQKYFF